jgi:hypothetical protein
MLHFFIARSLAAWFEWDSKEFQRLKANSFEMPILVVCYSPYCPHCSGLPQGTREYSDSDGNRTDVYVTLVNCQEGGCRHFDVRGTPKILLVMGENRKYWPVLHTRIGVEWNMHIDHYLSPNIDEIFDDEALLNATLKTVDGGTAFYIEVPANTDPILAELQNVSRRYRVYNSSISYRVNPSVPKAVFRAYTSPQCYDTAKPSQDPVAFFNSRLFGSLHRYDVSEGRDLVRSKASYALLIVDDELFAVHRTAPRELSDSNCGDFTFGWMKYRDAFKVGIVPKMNNTVLPIFFAHSEKSDCSVITQERVIDVAASNLLKRVTSGHACRANPKGRYRGMNVIPQFILPTFALLSLLRYFSFSPPKIE